VEAGLRTSDIYQPFPEEVNRRIADCIAERLYAPTETNRRLLMSESSDPAKIVVTGNTVIDALQMVSAMRCSWDGGALHVLPRDKRLVLVTAHRRESFGQGLEDICLAIRELAERFETEGVFFVYPVHLNRNVQNPVRKILCGCRNVLLLEPMSYLPFVHLMKACEFIMTDSGGIQEEGPALGVPVIVMRNKTERPDGVTAGVCKLAGTSRAGIVKEAAILLADTAERTKMSSAPNPYGDGFAAGRIVADILKFDSK